MAELKHEKLRGYLLELLDGELPPHSKLPTERELAEHFSVSRMTARRAIEQLQAEQRVYRIQGAGTFVAEPPIHKTVELTSFSEDMASRGLTPGTRHLRTLRMPAGSDIGYALGISPSDPVVLVERVRTANGTPMCVENSYVSAAQFPDVERLELYGSLYELLRDRYGVVVQRAAQTVRSLALDQRQAQLLEVGPYSAALQVERTSFDARNRPVERAISVYRGDRYTFEFNLHRLANVPDLTAPIPGGAAVVSANST